MAFTVNQDLVAKARAVLAARRDVYWVIGAACAGKSTVCRQLSGKTGLPVYDVDEHIYGSYIARLRAERHPACTTWLLAPDPFAWVMSLSLQEYDALNGAVQAECLDLFSDDVTVECGQPMLVDGGITHPAMLASVTSPDRIVCLETTTAERVKHWETSNDRAEMRQWIQALPDPKAMWRKFLEFDDLIARRIQTECRAAGIAAWLRGDSTTVEALVRQVAQYFGIQMPTPT